MRVALTGAGGLVGHPVAARLEAEGHAVVRLGRTPPEMGAWHRWSLEDPAPEVPGGCEALVHMALDHLPGRYRGGEGEDPEGFVRRNLDGTLRLFDAARRAGVPRLILLSSRAALGPQPPGAPVAETAEPRPDTLYGEVKRAAEIALAGMHAPDAPTTSLRATGVYGPAPPGRVHKWDALFAAFLRGVTPPPRAGTELAGADLADAVARLLAAPSKALGPVPFQASDLVLDRRELLARVARLTGRTTPLPEAAPFSGFEMATGRLRALGWRPGRWAALDAALPAMLTQARVGGRSRATVAPRGAEPL